MNDAIVITVREEDLPFGIGRLLQDQEYDLHWTDDPSSALALLKGPESLVIVDSDQLSHKDVMFEPFFERFYFRITTFVHSTISATVPAPIVRPPSLMAKRTPFSIAIGVISSTETDTLAPGSAMAGRGGSSTTPVTCVVRK